MGMVVKTNMMALNSHNALRKNNNVAARAMEKLSSGQRINRAADDASGLAISEKMKAKIKALDTAITNVEDGAALIQTAEGYMGEVHDMLNRMVELAEKSANGTYASVAGGGSYDPDDFRKAGVDRAALQAEMDQLCTEIDRIADTANFNGNKLLDGSISSGSNGLKLQIGETDATSDKLNVRIDSFYTKDLFTADVISVGTNKADLNDLVIKNESAALTDAVNAQGTVMKSGVVAESKTFDISTQDHASSVAVIVKDVISHVSMQRANLGAQQNRLEYTTNNLATASENTSAANSRIRDTDMAKTMMQYTQANVLTQAAQAMLAQANQAPQSVLQMIQ